MKPFMGLRRERKTKDEIDQWIVNNRETCLFCADRPLVANYKDLVKDHDHMTGRYRGELQAKTESRNSANTCLLSQLERVRWALADASMAGVQGEIKCIPTNTEKYISFSVGNLRFVDSVNFLLFCCCSLDKLVKGSDEFPIIHMIVAEETKRRLLLKKGIYPYEYMDSFERFGETELPEKDKLYSSLSDKGVTDEEYAHAQNVWSTFGCQNLGDYHDLNVATDVLLPADECENFQKCLPGEIRARPGALLQCARTKLGRAP